MLRARTARAGIALSSTNAARHSAASPDKDRGETRDRAAERPDILESLKKEWEQYVLDNRVLLPALPPAAKRDPASL